MTINRTQVARWVGWLGGAAFLGGCFLSRTGDPHKDLILSAAIIIIPLIIVVVLFRWGGAETVLSNSPWVHRIADGIRNRFRVALTTAVRSDTAFHLRPGRMVADPLMIAPSDISLNPSCTTIATVRILLLDELAKQAFIRVSLTKTSSLVDCAETKFSC